MCRIGEGVFPLVGRACRSLVSYYQKYGVVVEAAAEAGAASCVDWLVRDRKATGGRRCDDYGNDAGGLEGLEGDMTTTRGRKEFVRVLGGLCRGGHLAMAQRLVDGHWPGLVWPASASDSASASGNAGDCGDVELVDHVRASTKIMKRVCKKGHLDVVKWMTERFHIREPWEFLSPLNGALSGGHLEVAQWMASTFDLVSQFSKYNFLDAHSHACRSENLAVVKWCFENFPVNRTKFGILNFLAGKTSGCVKVCEYITPHIIVPSNRLGHELAGIRRVDVLHWASLTFPLFTPVGEIEAFCEEKGGLDVVKALVEEHSIKPSPEMFRASCRNKKDSVPLVKWLSTMLRLSPKDLCDSFAVAVGHSNTSIAAWLDDTFGVLKLAPPATILEKVCREMPAFEERVEGLKWLLKCPAMMVGESESSIMESLEHLVYQKFVKTAPLLIIEKFHVHEPPHSALLNSLLTTSARVDRLSQVKKIVSLGEFTKDAVTDALLNGFGCASTKSAKWFITHFQLERDHITGNQNMLLERLVSLGQENCAEWLINKFHITLDEFLSIYWPSSLWNFDLFAWKMILRVFPAITTTAIRQNLLGMVVSSPIIAQYTMKRFPDLTASDLKEFCRTLPWFPPETRGWLKSQFPTDLDL
ncbi:hypothetical protein Pelo_16032 [Pelomyxa schiedti]|nr:hypothetical protein Pelo_16032 [Pelomyxa schiedti]